MTQGPQPAGADAAQAEAAQRRLLVVSDSDSYTKWGAALASRLPGGWHADLAVLATDVGPSPRQLASALADTRWATDAPHRVHLDDLAGLVGELRPDAVLLALRGPLVRVTAPVLHALADRPVLVSGFPGLTIPAVPKAIIYREQVDLVVLHSRREVRDFAALAAGLPAAPAFGLASLAFLADAAAVERRADASDVVFAVQAKVPATREERIALVGILGEAARRRPNRRLVVKVRARAGEAQTHAEEHDLAELIADPEVTRELGFTLPPNLVVEDGPMTAHLARAEALVTVSSTAVLEAIAAGVPALLLDDFGVGPKQLNTVFEGSGLFGDGQALAAGEWRTPDPAWLDDNYFHDPADDDWLARLAELLEARDAAPLPVLVRRHNLTGGALRRAFERKKMLGSHDGSALGAVAMGVAIPVRGTVRLARRVVRQLRGQQAAEVATAPGVARRAESTGLR
ncbi:hypothetical protein GE115_14495 [Agromyces sp. CFH 90414]|uniref:Uncharacterized protein n=1 Tax=Agromyces agglutinans TaxID=2662258 RepID=A0A6I2FGK6_9MICO|nr:DUF6716 putative glycosyltransferase [Agromyces agglutinans]MRG61063.1 hypothetical protein [Agromyces agglutinans]